MNKLTQTMLGVLLCVAMVVALMPATVAAAGEPVRSELPPITDPPRIPEPPSDLPDDPWIPEPPPGELPEITYLDIAFEVIEDTRELTIVRINDILITQELDSIYSTREKAKAVLRMEDLNTGEVEEINITTSYKAGEYTTSLYSEGTTLTTFTTQFDPLKPGVLLEENLSEKFSNQGVVRGESQNGFSPLQGGGLRTFMWDGIWFVYGANRDINYSRPCVITHNICRFDNRRINGDSLAHLQLSYPLTSGIMGLPPLVVGGVLGGIIGTKVFPVLGKVIGAIIGGFIGHLTGTQLRAMLVDDRGTIWVNVHRSLVLVPIWPPRLKPRFLRTGGTVLWDLCRHTTPPPYRWR